MGLLRSAQELLATVLGLARTRLELLSVEMQELLARLVLIMIGAVAAIPAPSSSGSADARRTLATAAATSPRCRVERSTSAARRRSRDSKNALIRAAPAFQRRA